MKELLFKNFHDEDCFCDKCMDANFDEQEQLESMEVQELIDYAHECFSVQLSRFHDADTLAEQIMDLYEHFYTE